MNDLEFYRQIFEKELSRKKDLNDSVNIPIGLSTLIIALLSFINMEMKFDVIELPGIISGLVLLSLLLAIFFLTKSYNNLLRGYNYLNLPHTNELRSYQMKIEKYNQEVDRQERESFEIYLINNYAEMADKNGKVNKIRYYQLYLAKTTLMISIMLSMILLIVYLYYKFEL